MADNTTFSSNNYSVAYPTISADGQYMIFASDMPGGFGGLDLYVAENSGNSWTNPQNLGDGINTPGNDAFPFLTSEGVLYFASDGHLGLGGYDLYETKLQNDGYFGEITNLRAPINSNYDDFGLWMDKSQTKGFFTSNRPSEYGDDDIYSFLRQSYVFEAYVYDNLTKEALDSAEVVLTNLDNNTSVTLTTDADGKVYNNIDPNSNYKLEVSRNYYSFESAEFTSQTDDVYAEIPLTKTAGIVLDVFVVDETNLKELGFSNVTLTNLTTGEVTKVTTDAKGKSTFTLDPKTRYKIHAASKHPDQDSVYLAVSEEFNTLTTKAPAHLYTTIELRPACKKCQIKIENILYDLDKYYIRPDAALILDDLVKVLVDNPTMEIELASHTDCRGSAKYNQWLSSKRAEAAVNYIVSRGISASRLTSAGYGETQPLEVEGYPGLYCTCEGSTGPGKLDPRCTEAVHQLNRRTVFTITKE